MLAELPETIPPTAALVVVVAELRRWHDERSRALEAIRTLYVAGLEPAYRCIAGALRCSLAAELGLEDGAGIAALEAEAERWPDADGTVRSWVRVQRARIVGASGAAPAVPPWAFALRVAVDELWRPAGG